MKIESLKEVRLTKAKDIFLFDYQVVNLDPEIRRAYRAVLTSFIHFTGDIFVRDLTVDHLDMYIANLADGPSEGEEHTRMVILHYTVIGTWVRWFCAQRLLTERSNSFAPPHLTHLFPSLSSTKSLAYCC